MKHCAKEMIKTTPIVLENMHEFIFFNFPQLLEPNADNEASTMALDTLARGVEYIIAEILELSGIVCRDYHLKAINQSHVKTSIANDVELAQVFQVFCMQGASVLNPSHFKLFSLAKLNPSENKDSFHLKVISKFSLFFIFVVT